MKISNYCKRQSVFDQVSKAEMIQHTVDAIQWLVGIDDFTQLMFLHNVDDCNLGNEDRFAKYMVGY